MPWRSSPSRSALKNRSRSHGRVVGPRRVHHRFITADDLLNSSSGVLPQRYMVEVWPPTGCPSAPVRRTRSGCFSANEPTTKKVAPTPAVPSASRIADQCVPSGSLPGSASSGRASRRVTSTPFAGNGQRREVAARRSGTNLARHLILTSSNPRVPPSPDDGSKEEPSGQSRCGPIRRRP